MPRIELDFMYMKSDAAVCEWLEEQPPTNEWDTVLTAVDKDSGCLLAVILPTKAADHNYGCQCAVDFFRRLGHRDVQALRDQEPALISLVDNVKAECGKIGIKVNTRDAPRYSHASLGAIGRAQQTMQKQVRTLRTDVHGRYGIWLSTDRPAWPWLVRHAPWLLDRFAVKANGHTSYEDAYGTAYNGPVLQFLEACLFRRTKSDTGAMTRGRRAQKADNQWDKGLWLGKAHVSNEAILGTAQGIEMARAVKRLPEHLQVDKKLLDELVGTPWDPQLTAPKGRPRKSRPMQAVPAPVPAAPQAGVDPVAEPTPEQAAEGAPEVAQGTDMHVKPASVEIPPLSVVNPPQQLSVASPPQQPADTEMSMENPPQTP